MGTVNANNTLPALVCLGLVGLAVFIFGGLIICLLDGLVKEKILAQLDQLFLELFLAPSFYLELVFASVVWVCRC